MGKGDAYGLSMTDGELENLRRCRSGDQLRMAEKENARLRAELVCLKRQRHELKRQIAYRDRRANGMETCECCGKWLHDEEIHTDAEGIPLCVTCWNSLAEMDRGGDDGHG